jgi:uncharacterized membrane protein
MSHPDPQKPRGRIPLWLRLTFFASLALNLAVVGVVAGALLTGGGKWGPGAHAGHPGGPLTRALDPEDRRAIGRAMRANMPDRAEARRAMRSEMTALLTALRASAFDRAEVESRMAALRGQFSSRMALGQAALLDRLEGMSPTERAAYADRVEAALRKHKDRN